MCADSATAAPVSVDRVESQILTPDQRLRVFVSSTLQELAAERLAAREAVAALRLTPVLFELGARPYPPQELYRAYLEQSHVFVGIYWQSYGWLVPDTQVSGLEDEYLLSSAMPRLIYVKEPAPEREPRLAAFLDRLRSEAGVSYKKFETAEELGELLAHDLAVLITERFALGGDRAETRLRPLPAQSTSFVGRQAELIEIDHLLHLGVRLVTLTGPGGIGKTRLAIAAAEQAGNRFRDGVAFVPLEGLDSPELVKATISSALGLRGAGPDPVANLVAHLHRRSFLLLLDNFEHVIDAAPVVSALLEGAPELTVLVTSRELLRLRGEHELRVPPLAPEDEGAVLFGERAAAVVAGLELHAEDAPAITEICRYLEGVPLAIELAAPRLRVQTPQELLESLGEPLSLGGLRDAPARQRTLEAAIAWSYELLDAEERRLLDRLSVFRGSFTVEAAAAVSDLTAGESIALLSSLLDKSLVYRVNGEREKRFALLVMIREFAQKRLRETGGAEQTLEALASFYFEFAARAEVGIRSPEQRTWKRALDLEADTLRLVLDWLAERRRADELVTVLRGAWVWYWLSGQLDEGRGRTKGALAQRDELPVGQRAWLILLDGLFAFLQMDLETAAPALTEARSMFHQTGDRLGHAWTLAASGFAAGAIIGKDAALAELEEGLLLLEELGDAWGTAGALSSICRIRSIFGDFGGAQEVFERGLVSAERAGDDLLIALALTNLADYTFAVGEAAASRQYIERALELLDATGVRYAAPDVLEALARVDADIGEYVRAAELVGTAETLRATMRVPLWGPIAGRHKRFLEDLRAVLGDDVFDAAGERGRATSLDHWFAAASSSATSA